MFVKLEGWFGSWIWTGLAGSTNNLALVSMDIPATTMGRIRATLL
jgi:hypothetical protein